MAENIFSKTENYLYTLCYYYFVVKMDMKKLLEIGGAVEIKRDKETEMFLKSIEELEEVARKGKIKGIKIDGKDIKISKYEKGIRIIAGNLEEVLEEKDRIVYWTGYEWMPLQKGNYSHLVFLLSAAGNIITVDGKPYKITKPEEFAKAFYEGIKNEPTGFETREEPPLEEYLSRRCGPRRPPTIRPKERKPYDLIDMKEEEQESEGPKIYRIDQF